jgi:hypothetical protein
MTETSTTPLKNLYDKPAGDTCASEELTEEDQSFYEHIQPHLSKIIKDPSAQSVEFIVKYSRSL